MANPINRDLFRKAHWALALGAAAFLLWGVRHTRVRLETEIISVYKDVALLDAAQSQLDDSIGEFRALRDLKVKDAVALKSGLTSQAQAKRALYEAGLALQEERRLLEKQLEIMTTYLQINQKSGTVALMRNEQALEDFQVEFSTPRAFGGEKRTQQFPTQIVSKERFAHPERGTSEVVDGKLQWTPPQVGVSTRSLALGEYVMFTVGPLVIHGPPKRNPEHEAFPHVCLGLPLKAARKLYAGSFIGTRIQFKK